MNNELKLYHVSEVKLNDLEPEDVMFSTTPTYSAYIFQEVANIWSNKFSFVDGKNSDPLRWYDWMNRNKGKGNCPDYAMYVAYIAYKLHRSKVVICSVGLEKNSQTKQFGYHHIVPIYYEDGNWVLINYLGADNDVSNIYTFAGNDDLETVTKFIDQFSKAFLPIMSKHINVDYKSCEKVIKISKENRVRETIDKFYGKEISQKEILDYLFDTDDISLENYDFSMENNMNNEITLYHVSEVKINNLEPRVPDNFLTKNNFEDNTTKRVCFCPSIDQCLMAMSSNLKNKILHVYSIRTNDYISPKIDDVPDVKLTDEKWILRTVKNNELNYEFNIKIIDAKFDTPYEYTYGDNKKANLYKWNYKILKKFNK